ncbi:uncharacterized protein LOC130411544 [Triplophysa dalaica]|uniref:uncharacterized protein LOC130411544 n=1 Tax=Triplophysa dalaica TaxID=1582913 RepID=UPI0024DF96E6|nr:uncharacterized protein LOC130411544 [Triplophysa dalaica]
MVFGEEELTTLFNAGLRVPLSHAEMRMLRPLDFETVWLYAVDQSSSRVLDQPACSSPLVAIPEGRSLQIGIGGVTTPSSSPSAVSPLPASHWGKRGRRESWDSPSDTSGMELVGPLTASLVPATRLGSRSKRKRQRRAVRSPNVPKPVIQPSPRPAQQPDTQPAVQPDTQPAVQPDTQPAVQPDTQPAPSLVPPRTTPAKSPGTPPRDKTFPPNPSPFGLPSMYSCVPPPPLPCLLFLLAHPNPILASSCYP